MCPLKAVCVLDISWGWLWNGTNQFTRFTCCVKHVNKGIVILVVVSHIFLLLIFLKRVDQPPTSYVIYLGDSVYYTF